MRKPVFQLDIDSVFWVIFGVAIFLGIWLLLPNGVISFPAFALMALSLPIPFVLVVVPAYWLAKKVGQMLLGRLPPDQFKDGEPIRFDVPREPDSDGRPIQFSLKAVFIAITTAAIVLAAYPYLPLVERYMPVDGMFIADSFALLISLGVVVLAIIAIGYRCIRFFRWLNKRPRP